jgi:hypothetical protein
LKEKVAPILRLPFVCFQKVGLLDNRVGAEAASKFSGSLSRIKNMLLRHTAIFISEVKQDEHI